MVVKRSVKTLIKLGCVTVVIGILFLGMLAAWIATGPHPLPDFAVEFVEKQLNAIHPQYYAKIGTHKVHVVKEEKLIIQLNDVRILTKKENNQIVHLPQIDLDIKLLSLLGGNLFSDLTIYSPQLRVNTSTGVVTNNMTSSPSKIDKILPSIGHYLSQPQAIIAVEKIHVEDAEIIIDNGLFETVLEIPQGSMQLNDNLEQRDLFMHLNILFQDEPMLLDLKLASAGKEGIDIKTHFTGLRSNFLEDLFPNTDALSVLDLKSDGEAELLLGYDFSIPQIRFALKNLTGYVDTHGIFEEPVQIQNITARGNIYNLSQIVLDYASSALVIDKKFTTVQLDGSLNGLASFSSLSLQATIKDTPASALDTYWPKRYATALRQWLTHSVREGTIKKAVFSIQLNKADIERFKAHKLQGKTSVEHPFSKESLALTVDVERTKLQYHPRFPYLEDIAGRVIVDGHGVAIHVDKAKVGQTHVSNAQAFIPEIWETPLKLEIRGKVDGFASDLISHLEASLYGKEVKRPLTSILEVTGDAKGEFILKLPIKEELHYDEMDFIADVTVKNTIIPELYKKNDLQGNYHIKIKNNHVSANGKGYFGPIPIQLKTLDYYIDRKQPEDLRFTLSTRLNEALLKQADLLYLPLIKGPFDADLSMAYKGTMQKTAVSANITDSVIHLESIGFEKPQGQQAKLDLKMERKSPNAPLTVNHMQLSSENADIQGQVYFTAQNQLNKVVLNKARYGRNDYAAIYQPSSNAHSIKITGKSFDLKELKIASNLKKGNQPSAEVKHLSFEADLTTLFLKSDHELSNVKSRFDCTPACLDGNLFANIPNGKSLSLKIIPKENHSTIIFRTNSAETLVQGLNIYKYFKGGRLGIDATLRKKNGEDYLSGNMVVEDFTVVKAPKLKDASLEEIQQALDKGGLDFKRLDIPFTMEKKIIRITDAKSSESSTGITSSGTIDLAKGEIALEGLIIPASTLNSMLSSIPIVGQIIGGGDEKAVLAANYKVTGSLEEPKMEVNPLSILAPGLLRRLFK